MSLAPTAAGEGQPRPVRVLLADDQQMVRTGLATILQADGTINVERLAATGAEALSAVRAGGIDVVVMDIRMPVMDGIAATRALREEFGPAAPPVLILTTYGLDDYVYDALKHGARGFLLKDAPAAELIKAVHIVADGGALLDPAVTDAVVTDVAERRRGTVPLNAAAAACLTPRELDVLRSLARGNSNAEIAADLVLTEHTVKTHLGNILDKLQLRDRTQAVVFAYENGLVTPGQAR